jgi:bacterioferritin
MLETMFNNPFSIGPFSKSILEKLESGVPVVSNSKDYVGGCDAILKLNSDRHRLMCGLSTVPVAQQFQLSKDIERLTVAINKLVEQTKLNSGMSTNRYFSELDEKTAFTVKKLNALAGDELIAANLYRCAANVVIGPSNESVKNEFMEHSWEEFQHFDDLIKKIQELHGTPEVELETLIKDSVNGVPQLKNSDSANLVKIMYSTEIKCIKSYKEAFDVINKYDPVTGHLITRILEKEMQHEYDLNKLGTEVGLQLASESKLDLKPTSEIIDLRKQLDEYIGTETKLSDNMVRSLNTLKAYLLSTVADTGSISRLLKTLSEKDYASSEDLVRDIIKITDIPDQIRKKIELDWKSPADVNLGESNFNALDDAVNKFKVASGKANNNAFLTNGTAHNGDKLKINKRYDPIKKQVVGKATAFSVVNASELEPEQVTEFKYKGEPNKITVTKVTKSDDGSSITIEGKTIQGSKELKVGDDISFSVKSDTMFRLFDLSDLPQSSGVVDMTINNRKSIPVTPVSVNDVIGIKGTPEAFEQRVQVKNIVPSANAIEITATDFKTGKELSFSVSEGTKFPSYDVTDVDFAQPPVRTVYVPPAYGYPQVAPNGQVAYPIPVQQKKSSIGKKLLAGGLATGALAAGAATLAGKGNTIQGFKTLGSGAKAGWTNARKDTSKGNKFTRFMGGIGGAVKGGASSGFGKDSRLRQKDVKWFETAKDWNAKRNENNLIKADAKEKAQAAKEEATKYGYEDAYKNAGWHRVNGKLSKVVDGKVIDATEDEIKKMNIDAQTKYDNDIKAKKQSIQSKIASFKNNKAGLKEDDFNLDGSLNDAGKEKISKYQQKITADKEAYDPNAKVNKLIARNALQGGIKNRTANAFHHIANLGRSIKQGTKNAFLGTETVGQHKRSEALRKAAANNTTTTVNGPTLYKSNATGGQTTQGILNAIQENMVDLPKTPRKRKSTPKKSKPAVTSTVPATQGNMLTEEAWRGYSSTEPIEYNSEFRLFDALQAMNEPAFNPVGSTQAPFVPQTAQTPSQVTTYGPAIQNKDVIQHKDRSAFRKAVSLGLKIGIPTAVAGTAIVGATTGKGPLGMLAHTNKAIDNYVAGKQKQLTKINSKYAGITNKNGLGQTLYDKHDQPKVDKINKQMKNVYMRTPESANKYGGLVETPKKQEIQTFLHSESDQVTPTLQDKFDWLNS